MGASISLPASSPHLRVGRPQRGLAGELRPGAQQALRPGAPVIVRSRSRVPGTQPHSRVPHPRGEPLQPIKSLLSTLPPLHQPAGEQEREGHLNVRWSQRGFGSGSLPTQTRAWRRPAQRPRLSRRIRAGPLAAGPGTGSGPRLQLRDLQNLIRCNRGRTDRAEGRPNPDDPSGLALLRPFLPSTEGARFRPTGAASYAPPAGHTVPTPCTHVTR